MHTEVEVGDWEHECCGPAYERNTVIELSCLVVTSPADGATRYVESHHDLSTRHDQTRLRGRVVDIRIRHPDGSVDQLERLPGRRALRGFDDHDDGHLEGLLTGEPVAADSIDYVLTLAD